MISNFLPAIDKEQVKRAYETGNFDGLYEILVQPLHEELYRRQQFDFIDELSPGQQLLLAYDYLRTQVMQGGFIQFIQNGYIGLLPNMIEQLIAIGDREMYLVLDDVLKVYVLNRDILDKVTTVQEFAQLYDEFKEFEEIDKRYMVLNVPTEKLMLEYAMSHLHEFIA
ncbi:MAG: DUF4375 domain-containing protein [Chitinophagia bacterium]|nr:DUF4375 domain-containing protein [Chitinophagia bacterium]